MIPVKSIWLRRAEGPVALLGTRTVSSFEDADSVLRRWAETAPEGGSYDKCDFKITYEDGEIYEGRYDLKRLDYEWPSLRKHVSEFLRFISGTDKPAHLTDEQYQRVVKEYDATRYAEQFLQTREV